MTGVLSRAITAHGGQKRWQELTKLTAHFSVTGGLMGVKTWPNALTNAHAVFSPHHQRAEYASFIEPGQRGLFTPARTEIVTDAGTLIGQRDAPRQAFAGHTLTTPWDAQHLLYFTGYAMWTYLTAPFLFATPGFEIEEAAPWHEQSETWRRLHLRFPATVESHSTVQTVYFDATGLLRRHDYSVDIVGGTTSAHYVTAHKTFGGIVFPTKRRVYPRDQDNRPILDRPALAIDIHDIEAS